MSKPKKSEAIDFKIKPEETVELSFDVKSRNQRYFCTVQILKKKRYSALALARLARLIAKRRARAWLTPVGSPEAGTGA
jgi:hypothetical protein